jgi:hypothetical protein
MFNEVELFGVPENLFDDSSKVSHEGHAETGTASAVKVKLSLFESRKASFGIV